MFAFQFLQSRVDAKKVLGVVSSPTGHWVGELARDVAMGLHALINRNSIGGYRYNTALRAEIDAQNFT